MQRRGLCLTVTRQPGKAGDPRPPKELLEDFIRFGGFPIIALGKYDTQSAYQIVNGIYHTVVSRDMASYKEDGRT